MKRLDIKRAAFVPASAAAVLLPLLSAFAAAPGRQISDDYTMTVDGTSVDVVRVPMPESCSGGVKEGPDRQPYSYAAFEATGRVAVCVRSSALDLSRTKILPASKGVVARSRASDSVVFEMVPPMTVVLEPRGRHRALVVSANLPDPNPPQPNDPKVRYFGPGVHRADKISLSGGETLYLAPGAVLRGAVKAEGDGVRICGRGIIDGTPWPWAKGPGRGRLVSVSGRGTEVRDVTLLSSFEWTLVLDAVTNAVVDNVKVLGGRVINDDGIDICRAKDVTVRNSFVRCQDDCIAPKWWCEHVTVTNCTFWTDVANIVRIGYESDPPPARFHDFRMADCDILHLTLEPTPMTAYWCNTALSVQASNEERIGDVVFENLRFHEISGDDVLLVAKTFAVTQGYSYPKAGFIDGLFLKDIRLPAKDGALPAVYVETADAEHKVRNLRFENVTGAASERRVCVAKPAARTLHLIGDSTLEYRPAGSAIASWGELLRERLPEGFGLENHAVSGQSTRSFRPDWERDVLPRLKKGDVALIQFGHNDPWRCPAEYLRRGEVPRECSPAEMQANLERYVKEAREKGVEVVLLTPTPQRRRSARHEPYLAAIRAAATATGAPLVDLTELAGAKVWALGEEESKALFANDDVHPNLKGARLFADIGFAAIAAAALR